MDLNGCDMPGCQDCCTSIPFCRPMIINRFHAMSELWEELQLSGMGGTLKGRLCVCSTGDSQQAPQSNVVVLSDPLLKRALSRREKHELLVAAAILALGRDKSVKQQSVSFQQLSTVMAAKGTGIHSVMLARVAWCRQRPERQARLPHMCIV